MSSELTTKLKKSTAFDRRYLLATLWLACPLILGNMINHAVNLVDASMIGEVGVLPLAGAAFASSFFGIFMFFSFGFSVAVTVLVAEAHGRGDELGKKVILRNGLVVSSLGALALALAMLGLSRFSSWLGQPLEVVAIAQPYLVLLAFSLIPMIWMNVLRGYCEATGHPWAPLSFGVISFLSNIVLNYIFIFGWWFVPAMGLTGAGVATLLSRCIGFVLIAWYVAKVYQFNWRQNWWRRVEKKMSLEYTKIALPTGLQITLEAGLFNVATLLAGWIGAASMAAHLISLNIAAMAFMVPLGVSFALSIRVSERMGMRDALGGRRIIKSTLSFTVVMMMVSGLFIFLAKDWIPYWFVNEADPLAGQVIVLTSQVLWVVTFFQLSDGLNIVANGGLRGFQDIRWPTIAIFILYWLIGLPCSVFFGFTGESGWLTGWGMGLGPQGIWFGLATGVTLCAVVLCIRLRILEKKYFPLSG